jgi:uncharacterized circularly permuted ATP-grasp superfamily protein
LPSVFADARVHAVADYPARLLAALRAAAPEGIAEPCVVVLTPGVYNAAYFEHALLARLTGVQLVEGRDLVCTGNRVRMRTTQGERPVHVVYRRVDDEFLDPLHFRPDSVIGCPGIVNAVRAGNVTLANAIGNGVADDKLLYTYVPDLIRYYLNEDPIISNVETHRLDSEDVLVDILGRLDELVLWWLQGHVGGGGGARTGRAAHPTPYLLGDPGGDPARRDAAQGRLPRRAPSTGLGVTVEIIRLA